VEPTNKPNPLLQGIKINEYNINDLEDEIRVDQLTVNLLRHLYQDLTQGLDIDAEEAGTYCRGADYFLREFIIAERCENLFRIEPVRVRQFAGHWYITRTLEPNMVELGEILSGTLQFYQYLRRQKLVSKDAADDIAKHCKALDYYQQRIEDFWSIEDGGFDAWRQACPL